MKTTLFFLVSIIFLSHKSLSQVVSKPVDTTLTTLDSTIFSEFISNSWIVKSTPQVLEKEWVFASSDGENVASYINNKSILRDRKNNNDIYYKIWIKDFYIDNSIDGKNYKDMYSLERMYIDCKNMMYRTTRVVYYTKDDKVIKMLNGEDIIKWTEPIINSIGESILKKGCSLAENKLKK